jgi:phosphoribosylamine---glycine ligase
MRVLFVSGELIGADLCLRLKAEGCHVRLFIKDKSRQDCLSGMVEKTDDWHKDLRWVGKNGLIVFDDVGFGREQDELRTRGYNVVGGSYGGDKIEKDREFAQVIFSTYGITALRTYNFDNIKKAIKFIEKNKGAWVIKQNGHLSAFNYVGVMKDGSDAISVLESYKKMFNGSTSLSLQRKVDGVEIGIGRYFNGKDWVGPIEMNIEHKRLFHGGIGPMTGEMGTVMWYDNNEKNKLFQETLAKLKPYLQKVNFKGDIDINCIVDKNRIYPLEATSRFGCPSTQLQAEIHKSPWKDFLMALAKGNKYKLKYKKGYGVVISVSIPPFPYKGVSQKYYSKGVAIFFKKKLTGEEMNRLHFEEVSRQGINGKSRYCIAGSNGYILYVTGFGKTAKNAKKKANKLVEKIIIPKMFYRTDIGDRFVKNDKKLLKKWGWI